jgi:HEAT repeat protein
MTARLSNSEEKEMSVITVGRRPTLGEVLDYYTRADLIRYLWDTVRTRPVVMVIPRTLHWEPNWGEDEITASDPEQLCQLVVNKIRTALPDLGLDERPSYYPSFHQSVWKWAEPVTAPDQGERSDTPKIRDCVFEADLPTWRVSFGNVYAIVDLMDRHAVRYQHKFSGHRSLHVVIPAEVLPQGYRGSAAKKLSGRLIRWSGSQAHLLPQITRMPYSLNEDTGLVCTPIQRGALPSFRPWQANLHLVEVHGTWAERYDLEDQARTKALIDEIAALEADSAGSLHRRTSRAIFRPDREQIRSVARDRRLQSFGGQGEVGRAWEQLAAEHSIAERDLLQSLQRSDADARWLGVEAFFLNGAGLSSQGFYQLLREDEEYVRAAAVDVLLRFAPDLMPELIEVVGEPDRHQVVATRATHLLTLDERLRETVLTTLIERTDRSHDALTAVACVAGAVVGDWPGALDLIATVRGAPDLSDRMRAKLQALDLMSTMGGWDKRDEAKKSVALGALGRDVTDLLLIAAGSPHRRLRRGVVSALADLADERAVDLMIRSLADDYSKVRRGAIAGLIHIGEPAVDPLIEAAASDQVQIRRYAVHCLGRIGARRGKPAVLHALDDGEEVVRRQAVRALQGLATVDDVERLQQVLREENWENAKEAVDLLAGLGDDGRQTMAQMAHEEQNLAAAYCVAREGDPQGREILARRLSEGDPQRDTAAEYLRELRDERCIPYFASFLRTTTHWRGMWIGHELGRIGTPKAVSALIEALSSEHRFVRRGAVRGLAEARDPAAIEPLIRCLRDDDPKVRRSAADALVEIGDAAVEPLQGALGGQWSQSKHRRNLIHAILLRLGAQP